jgi:pimeloyl-ACP methyl ester carboxylesterase
MTFSWRNKALAVCGMLVLLAVATAAAGTYQFSSRVLGPEGHYLESNGVRIHYTDEGAGTPVLLLHGLGVTSHLQWREGGQIAALSKDYRVIALDARGHGRSDRPHDPKLYGNEMSEDLARLLDHLKIDKAHVVGYSMGGHIALKFAVTHPDRVLSAAVCAAGWVQPTPENLAFSEGVAQDFERGELGLILKRLGGYPELNYAERLGVWAALTLSGSSRPFAAAARGSHDLGVTENQLRDNKVPVLTLIGDKDGLFPNAQALHDRMAKHQLVVLPGMTHGSAGGDAAFLQGLEVFLQSNTPKPTT